MPPVNRNLPKRAESSESKYALMEFMREYPDDATCLDWLWRNRYSRSGTHAKCPKCAKHREFKRYVHTNTIEGFWSLVKRGVGGVYHAVSAKYLQGYLNEYAWRYNHRAYDRALFSTLLLRAATPA
jgi:hypothetical protein